MNILTIDVEDYFQVENFAKTVKFSEWGRFESRVEVNTERLLSILTERGVRATFFVLGWIAERQKGLVKKIHSQGHEIASHGYAHRLVYEQSPDEFRSDLRKSRVILEDIIQKPVIGYRAPTYSITKRSLWALDILVEEGFKYDSSIFPIHHDKGGLPAANRYPHKIPTECGSIMEFPISTIKLLGQNIPFSGGGYFRLLPYWFISSSIKAINNEGHPVMTYLHPWEFDPGQPRIKSLTLGAFRHYVNIAKAGCKLKKMLRDFKFGPARDWLDSNGV